MSCEQECVHVLDVLRDGMVWCGSNRFAGLTPAKRPLQFCNQCIFKNVPNRQVEDWEWSTTKRAKRFGRSPSDDKRHSVDSSTTRVRTHPHHEISILDELGFPKCSCPKRVSAWWSRNDSEFDFYDPMGDTAVAITTAPRIIPTIDRTLKSLDKAGFKCNHIHNDNGSPQCGSYNSFYAALEHLVTSLPDATSYVVCQDDVVLSENTREYLKHSIWPCDPRHIGAVSLFTISGVSHDSGGWRCFSPKLDSRMFSKLWGALSYIFTPFSARLFLARNQPTTHTSHGPDVAVLRTFRHYGLCIAAHGPSLAQHIGETSAISRRPFNASRKASSFIEDATVLLDASSPPSSASSTEAS